MLIASPSASNGARFLLKCLPPPRLGLLYLPARPLVDEDIVANICDVILVAFPLVLRLLCMSRSNNRLVSDSRRRRGCAVCPFSGVDVHEESRENMPLQHPTIPYCSNFACFSRVLAPRCFRPSAEILISIASEWPLFLLSFSSLLNAPSYSL